MAAVRTAESSPAREPDPQSREHSTWHLRFIALLVFLLLMVTTGILVIRSENHWRMEQELLLTTVATSQATVLERRLNNSLVSAYILGQQVRYENGELADFPTFADNLIRYLGGITNLQLAPGGVITQIHPLDERHRNALGLDIIANDPSRDDAIRARETRELVMAGPFQLVQGGLGLSGRFPVFLGEDDDAHFWGFASALITMEDFLADTDVTDLAQQGYQYQLWRRAPSGAREVFSGSDDAELPGPTARRAIALPGQIWYLDIGFLKPPGHMPGRYLALTIGLLASCLGSYLLFQLLLVPQRLRLEVQRKTAQLENLAYYDPLTDLANRKLFMEQLEQATQSGKRSGRGFALMFIDLDGFKHINDTLGHAEGDNLLKQIAHNLRACLRESDIVARLGGDEFTVLSLDTTNEFQALAVAEKLLAALSTPVTLSHQQITPSGSIGITLFPNDGESSSELMQNADLAMYKAKADGRNNYQFFSSDLQKHAQQRLQIEGELRHAIRHNQFHLEYQPVICLNTGSVLGVEALLRWEHPERGRIPPDEFIPVAEESGLITTLGNWVIRQACREIDALNRTRDGMPIQLAINLSPLQLHHRNLLQTIEDALAGLSLNADQITFEVTESTLMDRIDESLIVLNKIRRLGSRIAIDDFGTGYSSLSMLKLLPVNSVKIDRSFVRDIDTDGDDREIVAAIVSIGHRLGLKVVAEGAETREQLQFLCAHRCDTAQGFLFSRPVPADRLAEVITEVEPRLPTLLAELHRVKAARL